MLLNLVIIESDLVYFTNFIRIKLRAHTHTLIIDGSI